MTTTRDGGTWYVTVRVTPGPWFSGGAASDPVDQRVAAEVRSNLESCGAEVHHVVVVPEADVPEVRS